MPAKKEPDYREELRLTKSLLVASELQKRRDVGARRLIEEFDQEISFEPLHHLMIETKAWDHVSGLGIPPRLVFCHPDVLMRHPQTSLYYRGMAGLSIKAARDYFGGVETLEASLTPQKLLEGKALKMARTYNLYLSSIIVNSTGWSLENGHRAIIATMGISLDGSMRNKVGEIGEERVRRMVTLWLLEHRLIADAEFTEESLHESLPRSLPLLHDIQMKFAAEPDITFEKDGEWLATVEIKGGIDPAGALERYGAAKKSFEHAVRHSGRCKNFYIGGVVTVELKRRIQADRLVEQTYEMIELLRSDEYRQKFFTELFHHTLRIF